MVAPNPTAIPACRNSRLEKVITAPCRLGGPYSLTFIVPAPQVPGVQVNAAEPSVDAAERDAVSLSFEHGTADRKSTRLNSSHGYISYAVFCLKKKTPRNNRSIRTRCPSRRRVA